MKNLFPLLYVALFILIGCDGGGGASSAAGEQDTLAPREATDPVPEPPANADTTANRSQQGRRAVAGTQEVHYRISGTEPFWSLTIGRPYSTYRSMAGDSISFTFREPENAAGRPEEWAQLFQLDENSWALLRKGNGPCSDGMSDQEHAFTATVWLNGQLLDGCGDKP